MPSSPVKTEYDVIIVGGGPAGLFAAYYLGEYSNLDVLLIEQGKAPQNRSCPIDQKGCIQCKPCNILCGIGGAGLFSDGKLNFIHKLGKTDLTQFMTLAEAKALIDETEIIFNRFNMDGKVFPTDMTKAMEIRKEARKNGIDLLIIKQKHLGSENLPNHITKLAEYVQENGITFHHLETAKDIITEGDVITGVITNKRKFKCSKYYPRPW